MIHRSLLLLPLLIAVSCTPHSSSSTAPTRRPATRGVLPLTRPVVAPITQPAYGLSNFAEQTLQPVPAFAFVTRQTTLRVIQTSIDSAMKDLFKDPRLGGQIVGPMIFNYIDMTGSPDEAFTLEIGFPVQQGFQPEGAEIRVRTLGAMKCFSVNFEGSMKSIDKAYDKLIPVIQARKLKQTGEIRETYYKWDGPDAITNQILVAVGVE